MLSNMPWHRQRHGLPRRARRTTAGWSGHHRSSPRDRSEIPSMLNEASEGLGIVKDMALLCLYYEIHNRWKTYKNHVPNHQPVMDYIWIYIYMYMIIYIYGLYGEKHVFLLVHFLQEHLENQKTEGNLIPRKKK